MTAFEVDDFYKILSKVNTKNKFNFDSFTEHLKILLEQLTYDHIEQVIEYLVFESNINSDSEVKLLSINQIIELCSFVNGIRSKSS